MSSPTSQNGSTRAADTDRIQVAQFLTDAAAQGRLPMSEYESRLTKAYAAKTYDELALLSADLPGAMTSRRGSGPCRPAPSTVLMAIMSGFERRGRWNVPRRLTTFAILVPPEVNVDLHGVGVMGSFDHAVQGEGSPGAPCVRVRGFSLWGSVGVKRRKRKEG
jgi:hypothetical protein